VVLGHTDLVVLDLVDSYSLEASYCWAAEAVFGQVIPETKLCLEALAVVAVAGAMALHL